MEILERGLSEEEKKESWRQTWTCRNCKSILCISANDLFVFYPASYHSELVTYCPTCDKKIILDRTKETTRGHFFIVFPIPEYVYTQNGHHGCYEKYEKLMKEKFMNQT